MDKCFSKKMVKRALQAISGVMIVLACFSFADKLFITPETVDIATAVMLIMEGLSILSFFYAYYLFYKKKEYASLFILLPLTIFFLYLTVITSYTYPISSYGTLSCIIMLLTVDIKSGLKAIFITIIITLFFAIFNLQNFEIIPMQQTASAMTIEDKFVLVVVVFISLWLTGFSLLVYHVNTLSKGTIENLLKQYEEILVFAKDTYSYTDRETEVARCLIQGLSNVEIADKLDIANNTVKSHVKHILDKAGIKSRKIYYETLLSRFTLL